MKAVSGLQLALCAARRIKTTIGRIKSSSRVRSTVFNRDFRVRRGRTRSGSADFHLCRDLDAASPTSPSSSTPMRSKHRRLARELAPSMPRSARPRRARASALGPSQLARRVTGLVHHSRSRDRNISRSNTPSGWPRRASSHRSAASATATTTPSPKPMIGLFKTEVIHRRGPWRSFEAVEHATLEWVDWFNNRLLLEPIGNIPPAEAEAAYHAALETRDVAA